MQLYDITPDALSQLRRLECAFIKLLRLPSLALPTTFPEDAFQLTQLVRKLRDLPEPPKGTDVTLLVYPSTDPRKPYYRFQVGPQVIEIGMVQVNADPDESDGWVAFTYFGAVLGLGSGCRDSRTVKELTEWVDEFLDECRRTSVRWRVETGANGLAYMRYPEHLFGDA